MPRTPYNSPIVRSQYPYPTPRSGSRALRYAARVTGARAARAAAGVVRNLFSRATRGTRGARATQTPPFRVSRVTRGTQMGKRDKYFTMGKYAGKFKKRYTRFLKTDYYRNYGFCNTTEITGTVSDPDCVYVGHSTTSGHRILTVFLQSALRKLYKQSANWTCTNITDPLLGYQGAGDGWRLILFVKEVSTGVITQVTYDTTTTDTIARIVGDTAGGVAPSWPDLYNFWINYLQNGPPSGATQQPTRLALYQRDGNITSFYHFMGDIYFPNEVINLYIKSELKIQNRTLSASGSGDAEDVSNNPLIGRSYQFTSANPRPKVEGVDLIGTILDATGVITRRAAEFPAATQVIMREPPSSKIFWNCNKEGKVILEPGNIKKDVIYIKIKKPVYKFFQDLDWRPSSTSVASALSMKGYGKSSLFALEDMINVNVSQNLSIAYEVNRVEMCYLSTSKQHPAQGGFYQNTQSNNPA